MSTKNKIEIYTNENCSYCKQIKEKLNDKGIEFKNNITVENKEEWQKVINLTGLSTVPTIKIKENYFIPGRDFQSPDQMINIIENFEESDYSESKQTLERIKTLNFNINQAFRRLDQLLRQIETKINTDEHKSTD